MSKIDLILFLLTLTVYSFFIQYTNVNQNTRFDLTRAIVEEGTVAIDQYHENTIDKSFFEGHWYTDKAPGLSFIAVPFYAALLTLQPASAANVRPEYPLYVVNAFAVALPSALLVLLVMRWMREATGNDRAALAVATAFAFGTLILPFATLFFGHNTSAALSFGAFYILWRLRFASGPAGDGRWLFLAGLCAGLASLVEYPNAAVAALLALYVLSIGRVKKKVLFYLAGLLPPILAFLAYNAVAFGAPFTLSYLHAGSVVAGGQGNPHPLGLTGLWAITIGPRGLFTLSPVMLLAIPGLIALSRRSDLRREFWLFTLIVAGMGTVSWLYFQVLGGVPGPRYLITSLPFATASIILLLPRWRWLFVALATASMALMFMATATNPMAPMSVANPILDYWGPNLVHRQVVMTTTYLRFGLRNVASLLFLVGILGVGALAGLAWLRLSGQPSTTSALAMPSRRWLYVLNLCLVLLVIAYLAFGFPIDVRNPFSVPATMLSHAP